MLLSGCWECLQGHSAVKERTITRFAGLREAQCQVAGLGECSLQLITIPDREENPAVPVGNQHLFGSSGKSVGNWRAQGWG